MSGRAQSKPTATLDSNGAAQATLCSEMIPDGAAGVKVSRRNLTTFISRLAGRPAHFSTNQDCMLARLSSNVSFADQRCDSVHRFMCEVIKCSLQKGKTLPKIYAGRSARTCTSVACPVSKCSIEVANCSILISSTC